ncbi:MAG: DUF3168 domain-containing protein [Pseudomonadota bacterium]
MVSACAQLQEAVFQALSTDAALTDLIGPGKVFDHVPERARFPYIVLGAQTGRDWSTATEDGTEIDFFVHVWSREKGRQTLTEMEHHVRRILLEPLPDLTHHHLINLRFIWAEFSRNRNLRHRQGALKFRGVTEPK